MSLDQSIKHGKEHRKSYLERGQPGTGDVSCRPNGWCSYCRPNRLFGKRRLDEIERFERQLAPRR